MSSKWIVQKQGKGYGGCSLRVYESEDRDKALRAYKKHVKAAKTWPGETVILKRVDTTIEERTDIPDDGVKVGEDERLTKAVMTKAIRHLTE